MKTTLRKLAVADNTGGHWKPLTEKRVSDVSWAKESITCILSAVYLCLRILPTPYLQLTALLFASVHLHSSPQIFKQKGSYA